MYVITNNMKKGFNFVLSCQQSLLASRRVSKPSNYNGINVTIHT